MVPTNRNQLGTVLRYLNEHEIIFFPPGLLRPEGAMENLSGKGGGTAYCVPAVFWAQDLERRGAAEPRV